MLRFGKLRLCPFQLTFQSPSLALCLVDRVV
jgi:hypothetical protein